MTEVERHAGESIEKTLRKFKRRMREEGLLDELRKREFYEKPSERRRKREARGRMREQRRQREFE